MPAWPPCDHGERGVGREFLCEDRGGNFVEPRAAIGFRNRAAEQAQLARLLQELRHQPVFVLPRAREPRA